MLRKRVVISREKNNYLPRKPFYLDTDLFNISQRAIKSTINIKVIQVFKRTNQILLKSVLTHLWLYLYITDLSVNIILYDMDISSLNHLLERGHFPIDFK